MKYKIIHIFIFLFLFFAKNIFPQSGWFLQSPLPNPYASLSIKFVNNYTGVSVGFCGAVCKTTNGGVSWKNINSNTTKSLRYLVFVNSNTGFAIGDSSIIIKTTNKGDNWSISYNTNSEYAFHSIYFINANTGFAFRDSSNILLKTTDCGNNWISYTTDLYLPSFIFCYPNLYFLNENTGIFYLGIYFYKTTNGGINWSFKDISPLCLTRIHFFNQNTGIATGFDGYVVKTTDAGNNWSILSQVTPIADLIDMKFLDSLNGYLFSREIGIIYRTTNQGINWMVLANSAYGGNKAFDFPDINTGFIASPDRFIKTTTAGALWDVITSGTVKMLHTIHFANQKTGFAAGENIILKTTNSGNFWTVNNLIYNPNNFIDIHCFDTSNALVFSSHTIQKTTDGGMNWTMKLITGGEEIINGVCYINNIVYYCAENGTIGKSTNAGENWFNYEFPGNRFQCLSFVDENTGYASDYYYSSMNSIPRIYKTINGGMNWNLIYTSQYINIYYNKVFFTDTLYGFVSASGFLMKTSNGGYNWTYTVPPSFSMFHFLNKNTGYICSYPVCKTTNGGLNWFSQSMEQNSGLYNIYILDSNIGYAVGEFGTILKTTDGGGSIWVKNISTKIPDSYLLHQNYPNPFNPTTIIRYQIEDSRYVIIKVYDILGREITTLINEKKPPGIYEVSFDGYNLPSGLYFYRIQAGDFSQVKKMVLIK